VSLRHPVGAVALVLVGLACGKPSPPADETSARPSAPPDRETPVALNGEAPIQYPPRLFDQKVEGEVLLRLFVDSSGRLVPESSRVAESSGYPALDSAALAGSQKLRFAPARRRGMSVAAAFLQPIDFRRSQGRSIQGSPDAEPH
jgi:protein TonB